MDKDAVEALLHAVSTLVRDGCVVLPGVGWLTVHRYTAYEGRDPRTGDPISVPNGCVAFFKVDPELHRALVGLGPTDVSLADERARYLHAIRQDLNGDDLDEEDLKKDDDGEEDPTTVIRTPGAEIIAGTIRGRLCAGQPAEIRGLGIFDVLEKPSRRGANPETGDAITVPARRIVRFRVAETLKARLKLGARKRLDLVRGSLSACADLFEREHHAVWVEVEEIAEEFVSGLSLDAVRHFGEVARVLGHDDLRASFHSSSGDVPVLGIVPHRNHKMLVVRDDGLGECARHRGEKARCLRFLYLKIRDEVTRCLIEDLLRPIDLVEPFRCRVQEDVPQMHGIEDACIQDHPERRGQHQRLLATLGIVVATEFLGELRQFIELLVTLEVSLLLVRKNVLDLQPSVLAGPIVWQLVVVEKTNEVLARHVEEIGRLLGRHHCPHRNDQIGRAHV